MSKAGGKSVSFKVPQSRLASGADEWIANRGAEPAATDREAAPVAQLRAVEASAPPPAEAPKERIARLTIDVPEGLHRRVKMQCAGRGQKMSDVVREFLEREFPEA